MITLNFNEKELQIVLTALANMPYNTVAELIQKIAVSIQSTDQTILNNEDSKEMIEN